MNVHLLLLRTSTNLSDHSANEMVEDSSDTKGDILRQVLGEKEKGWKKAHAYVAMRIDYRMIVYVSMDASLCRTVSGLLLLNCSFCRDYR